MLSAAFGIGLIFGVIFDLSPLSAESKAEKELRARLAVSEAARLSADKEKEALLAALTKAQAAMAAASTKTQSGQVKASDAAAVNAAGAQATAQINAAEARQTAGEAKAEREKASEQASENAAGTQWSLDRATMALLFGFFTLIAGFWNQSRREDKTRRWFLEDAQIKHEAQLEAVRIEGDKSTKAIEHSNHLTEKIVEMREDFVVALRGKENRTDDRGQEADAALANMRQNK